METEFIPIEKNDTFCFECSSRVACFNECCRDLNQFLTPYDIIRLNHNLGLTSSRFIERYTTQHTGPESGLPMLALKPSDSIDQRCPFVTASGCRVYPDRPSSCRIYPLARAISRSRENGRVNEYFARLKEPHCLGHAQNKNQSVSEWIQQQGLAEYIRQNDKLIEIISLKNRLYPGNLDLVSSRMVHLAFYDLDNFRKNISNDSFLSDFFVPKDQLVQAEHDDVALLQLGYNWIKAKVFNEDVSF